MMTEDVSDCLRRLPRKIKIGAYDWKVTFEDGDDKHGEADFEFHLIRLWPETLTSPSHCVGILLHECLHVIYDNEGIQTSVGDPEEEIVSGFETGLVALLRDNPKLVTWLKKGLK